MLAAFLASRAQQDVIHGNTLDQNRNKFAIPDNSAFTSRDMQSMLATATALQAIQSNGSLTSDFSQMKSNMANMASQLNYAARNQQTMQTTTQSFPFRLNIPTSITSSMNVNVSPLPSPLTATNLQQMQAAQLNKQQLANNFHSTFLGQVHHHVSQQQANLPAQQAVATVVAEPVVDGINVNGQWLTKDQVLQVYALRSRQTCGPGAMEQASAGRSAVVGDLFHITAQAVRDIWTRKLGAELTKTMWTDHEELLYACDKYKSTGKPKSKAVRMQRTLSAPCDTTMGREDGSVSPAGSDSVIETMSGLKRGFSNVEYARPAKTLRPEIGNRAVASIDSFLPITNVVSK